MVKTVNIQQPDRLAVVTDLPPGPDFEQLLQRTDAARQGNKTVGQFGHPRLTGVHVGDDFQLGQATVRRFGLDQPLGNDAYCFTTSL
ncbi:hypothetical protein D3C77_743310 [compost metagenome]